MYCPNIYEEREGSFVLPQNAHAVAHPVLDHPVIKELFLGHAFRLSSLTLSPTDELIFRLGNAATPPLAGEAYAVSVEKDGACVCAKGEKELIWGLMMLLDAMVCEEKGVVRIPCFYAAMTPRLSCRMVHFCVFPDTELWELKRFVRYAGALCYTHLVVEFWGMLRYESEPKLSWRHAFTKEELAPVLEEARALGMEIVPMLNHWGHATGSRVMHGKHSALDNDPSLAYLFSADGWRWAIERDATRSLLRELRRELTALCGEGSYFHIGCDEAYGFRFTEESMREMCAYFASLADELTAEGRRPILWGDMLLHAHPDYIAENRYDANAPTAEAEKRMLSLLDRRFLIADWQYNIKKYPVETSLLLQKEGFEVMVCPWQTNADIDCCVKTAAENNLYGVMHTTWHTLSAELHQVLRTALLAMQGGFKEGFVVHTGAAALLRKVFFVDGDYEKAGWAKHEIGVIC